ncbi:MAG: transposase [Patescibacteria group bacterium]|nr:transposase [Candidatus Beckwithbacteria bacterium]MDZ4229486.1 transposase [Patescibacteria group bacterium]
MPSRNIIKEYKENTYYHIYNRGVDKRIIFSDKNDYKKFLGYLKFYLSPTDLQGQTLKASPSRVLKNYTDYIQLLAYCLIPNHFHLLVYQTDALAIAAFMQSLCTKYSIYFNKKSSRSGPLFQGRYRAVEVTSEEQLIYLTKYIHRNPIDILPSRTDLEGYKYSSYGNYLKKFSQAWIKTDNILEYFKKSSYKEFVEETEDKDILLLKEVAIDIDL